MPKHTLMSIRGLSVTVWHQLSYASGAGPDMVQLRVVGITAEDAPKTLR